MLLDGKVAIVTGGATGLGRCHALELARQGARVVVNDLGAKADGSGRDESAARAVCDEIKSLGGEAVAHFGDVADWNASKSMFEAAVEHFGDVNVVVCNAGFIRDAILFNMTEKDFDDVVRVHLKGHFCTIRHATAYWRERAKAGGVVYGRLIATSSESAFFAPPGQPNYSAAKAGIIAITMGAAQLMQKYGITANVIMPRARTRRACVGPRLRGLGEGRDGGVAADARAEVPERRALDGRLAAGRARPALREARAGQGRLHGARHVRSGRRAMFWA